MNEHTPHPTLLDPVLTSVSVHKENKDKNVTVYELELLNHKCWAIVWKRSRPHKEWFRIYTVRHHAMVKFGQIVLGRFDPSRNKR